MRTACEHSRLSLALDHLYIPCWALRLTMLLRILQRPCKLLDTQHVVRWVRHQSRTRQACKQALHGHIVPMPVLVSLPRYALHVPALLEQNPPKLLAEACRQMCRSRVQTRLLMLLCADGQSRRIQAYHPEAGGAASGSADLDMCRHNSGPEGFASSAISIQPMQSHYSAMSRLLAG